MNKKRLQRMYLTWAEGLVASGTPCEPAQSEPQSGADKPKFPKSFKEFPEHHKDLVLGFIDGRVRIIGFEDLKLRFGPRWPEMEQGAHKIADACIQKRFVAGDLVSRVTQDDYLILFDKLTSAEAEARANDIADEITRLALGKKTWGITVAARPASIGTEHLARLDEIGTIGDLEFCYSAMLERLEKAELEEFEALKPSLSLSYWPTFNVRKKLVSVYDCTPIRQNGAEHALIGNDAYPRGDIGALTCALDCHVLHLMDPALRGLGDMYRKAVLLVPVHYRTLAVARYRSRFLEHCDRLPASARRRVIIQVIHPPPGLATAHFKEIPEQLSAMFLGVICRVGPDYLTLGGEVEADVLALTIDADRLDDSARETETRLAHFVARAKQAGIKTMLSSVRSVPLATAAMKAGIDYLNGAALADRVESPGRVYLLR